MSNQQPTIQLSSLDDAPRRTETSLKREEVQLTVKKYARSVLSKRVKKKQKKLNRKCWNIVRSMDQFGQPIPLNYRGSDTYKTVPGAILSMIAMFLLCTGLLRGFLNLVAGREWKETTQVKILDYSELQEEVFFKDYSNFSAGFELKVLESSRLNSREEYLEHAELLAEVYAVIETAYVKNSSGIHFVDEDTYDFTISFDYDKIEPINVGRKHPQKPVKQMINSQNFLQFDIDLSQTMVQGSESTTMDIRNRYVTFLNTLDYNTYFKKIIGECRDNATCGAILKTDSEVFNRIVQETLCNDNLNSTQQHAYIEHLREAIKDDTQKYLLHNRYYQVFESKKVTIPSGLSSCQELGVLMAAGREECDFEDPEADLSSKCLYKYHLQDMSTRLNKALSYIEFKPVVYDEITHFKDGKNAYPFQERKSKLPSAIVKSYPVSNSNPAKVEHYQITLQQVEVCLDDNIFAEFFIFDEDVYAKCDQGKPDFKVLQRSEQTVSYMNIPMDTNIGLTLTLDNQKTLTVVRSYKFYDMLADNGGFFEALLSLFAFFGKPLSSLIFRYSVAKESFYTRPKKKHLQKEFSSAEDLRQAISSEGSKKLNYSRLKALFPRIHFTNWFYALSSVFPASVLRCCKGLSEQNRILEKANSRFEEELDVVQLLRKVRLSTDLWTQALSRNQKRALKFSKSNVIVQKDPDSRKRRAMRSFGISSSSEDDGFSFSNSSSESSSGIDQELGPINPEVEKVHNFFAAPVYDAFPLPKQRPLNEPEEKRRLKVFLRDEYFSDPSSANSIALSPAHEKPDRGPSSASPRRRVLSSKLKDFSPLLNESGNQSFNTLLAGQSSRGGQLPQERHLPGQEIGKQLVQFKADTAGEATGDRFETKNDLGLNSEKQSSSLFQQNKMKRKRKRRKSRNNAEEP